jgi:acyl-CoA thioesterase
VELPELLRALALEPVGEGRYRADNLPTPGAVVFGGQMLAQAIVAAARIDEAKDVASISMLFARGARVDVPLEIDVDPLAQGRSFASASVTVGHGTRRCARALVLLGAADADVIRHAPTPPVDAPPGSGSTGGGWETSVVGGVDIGDPDAVGPAELAVWSRFPGAPDGTTVARALLAYASEGFLIGTAMRPHAGVGQVQAHVSLDTTVLRHEVTFHEPFAAGDWLLLSFASPYAGRGRAYGRGHAYDVDGRLVASMTQESMIRAMGAPASVEGGGKV